MFTQSNPTSGPRQVCIFHQKGNCRYGDKCWNIHQGPAGVNFLFGNPAQTVPAASASKGTFEEFENQVEIEMSVWENSGMWLLSCLGPLKDHPPFPGFTDWSPEEIRLEAYRDEAFRDKLLEKFQRQKQLRDALKSKTPEAYKVLKSVFFNSSQSAQSPFTKSTTVSANQTIFGGNTSIFATSSAASNENIFTSTASQASIFSQSTFNSAPATSIFGGQSGLFTSSASQISKPSVFEVGNSTQFNSPFQSIGTMQQPNSVFSNMAGQQSQQQSGILRAEESVSATQNSIFTQNNQNLTLNSNIAPVNLLGGVNPAAVTSSIFGVNPTVQVPKQDIFSSNSQASQGPIFSKNPETQNSIFGNSQSLVPNATVEKASCSIRAYTQLSDLSEEDRIEFEKDTFSRIPLCPPPREMCI